MIKLKCSVIEDNIEIRIEADEDTKPTVVLFKDGEEVDSIEVVDVMMLENAKQAIVNAMGKSSSCTTLNSLLLAAWIQYAMQEDHSWLDFKKVDGD